MLLIYTKSYTPRLKYTFDLVFREILGLEYSLVHNADEFSLRSEPKLNYSEAQFGNELFIFASPLLFQKGTRDQQITVFDWENTRAFFASHPKYVLPFDPFAASFYMVTRYEEYLPHSRDVHDRFDASESLAFKKGFLHQPVVNIYAYKIKEILLQQFPELKFETRTYSYLSTIDIDNAWAYREKGLMRIAGAIARSLFKLEFGNIAERLAVLAGKKKDPYDTYDLLTEIKDRYNLECIYFFLLGDYAENDKNISVSSRNFQTLIKSIADYNDVGIHPSYASAGSPGRIRMEQSRLQKVIHREVTKSRQHFLRLHFPTTYRILLDCDICDDYTMGFSGQIGFRAGICSAYYQYDLDQEQTTRLRIHPFAVMDATLRYYMKIQPDEVMALVAPMIREIKKVNGTFITLWHNESLSNDEPWEGWRGVYEEIVKAALS